MLRTTLTRIPLSLSLRASSSRSVRALSSTARAQRDILEEFSEQITPRELVERKRKEMEAKYGDKLKKKAEAEGVANLDELKEKVQAPTVVAKVKAKQWAQEETERASRKREEEEEALKAAQDAKLEARAEAREAARQQQAAGDRAGVKPLASIINLPLLLMTPHTAEQIGGIWNAYHTTHPTLANSYLSASLPAATYESMVSTARANPFFVLPLPRDSSDGGDAFEMFYMQWLFHAPPSPLPDANAASSSAPLPPITSVIFTTLAEFKANGEWAQPYLTLTHYSDLARSHESVLMRGEITAQTAQGPAGSPENPGFLLSRNQAHLLALALQRFYCANLVPLSERASDAADRATRAQALRDFREKPQEWDWQALVKMAYAGIA